MQKKLLFSNPFKPSSYNSNGFSSSEATYAGSSFEHEVEIKNMKSKQINLKNIIKLIADLSKIIY